ncbi:MAG: hypothetical protein AABY32_01300 [Nanoarchaeota archaeon]
MGMDVYGRRNKEAYFRANCWSWRPIHFLIKIADNNINIFDEKTMNLIGSNDGAGLKTQKECNLLADELERLLDNPDLITREGSLVVSESNWDCEDGEEKCQCISFKPIYHRPDRSDFCTKDGHFINLNEAKKKNIPLDDLCSPYSTSFPHVKEFIEFLRICGGFKVC